MPVVQRDMSNYWGKKQQKDSWSVRMEIIVQYPKTRTVLGTQSFFTSSLKGLGGFCGLFGRCL